MLDPELVSALLDFTRSQAKRLGIAPDDVEDCTMEFALRLLDPQVRLVPEGLPDSDVRAYLCRCAQNHIHNFRCATTRRWRREVSLEDGSGAEGVDGMGAFSDTSALPEVLLLRAECRQRMLRPLDRLTPIRRDCFRWHCLYEEPVPQIALSTGRTLEATYKLLARGRKQLQMVLEADGTTEPELWEYLIVSLSGGQPN